MVEGEAQASLLAVRELEPPAEHAQQRAVGLGLGDGDELHRGGDLVRVFARRRDDLREAAAIIPRPSKPPRRGFNRAGFRAHEAGCDRTGVQGGCTHRREHLVDDSKPSAGQVASSVVRGNYPKGK